jgi:hypothetical protein
VQTTKSPSSHQSDPDLSLPAFAPAGLEVFSSACKLKGSNLTEFRIFCPKHEFRNDFSDSFLQRISDQLVKFQVIPPVSSFLLLFAGCKNSWKQIHLKISRDLYAALPFANIPKYAMLRSTFSKSFGSGFSECQRSQH